MGPVRSLYEQEGDLESTLLQQTPVVLRPVQMFDCGERYWHFRQDVNACMSQLVGKRAQNGTSDNCHVNAWLECVVPDRYGVLGPHGKLVDGEHRTRNFSRRRTWRRSTCRRFGRAGKEAWGRRAALRRTRVAAQLHRRAPELNTVDELHAAALKLHFECE